MSNKFKLIKSFPDSPLVGTVVEFYNNWGMYGIKNEAIYTRSVIENYPEFWEKVIEKDYEILSLSLRRSDKHQIQDVSEYKNGYIAALINCDGNKINSVKRLSDCEVFTVGDNIDGTHYRNITITSIDLNPKYTWQIQFNHKDEGISLKNAKKVKTPLFKTEDGVDIYEGDSIFGVSIRWEVFGHFNDLKHKIKHWGRSPIFCTKEKAEEYILMNKPCLSINEINNFLQVENNTDWKYNYTSRLYLEKLKAFVKSKL